MQRLFYIEGESFLRMMMEKLCKLHQIECYTLENTNEGSYIIHDFAPDLLVVDLLTVEEGGWDVIEEIISGAQIPVVCVGFPDQLGEVSRQRLEQFGLPLVEKPLSSQTIIEQLKSFTRKGH